jgi:hypothetical protein
MGNLSGVDIHRGKLGTNVSGNADAISGLLATGIATAGLALNTTKKISSLKEAEDLGITKEYDETNAIRVHRHISEFYRIAGGGTPLYLCLYSGTPAVALDAAAKAMVASAKGEIRQIAVAYSPTSAYSPTLVDGLEPDVYAALSVAQALAKWTQETFRPLQVLLEGRGIADTVSGIQDLRDIEVNDIVMQYDKVSLCIGQDYDYAETQDAIGKKFADVGSMLGSVASKAVNENIGEVETSKLTDVDKNIFVNAALSNHKKVETMDADLSGLDDKGYIFPISYTGIAGYYWNGDHTCTPVIVDEDGNMNESNISYGRTLDKQYENCVLLFCQR